MGERYHMTNKKTVKNYTEIHKKLKSLGLLSNRTKKSENYTTNEKRQLSRTYNHFKQAADWAFKPEQLKSGATMTATTRILKTKKEIHLARESGMRVFKNKIIIKHDVREKVRLKRSATPLSEGVKVLQIEKKKGRVRRDTQLAEKYEIMQYLENMRDVDIHALSVTVQIGDHNAFGTAAALATTHEDLLNYISNWEPKDAAKNIREGKMTDAQGRDLRTELIGQMIHVYIY